MIRIVAVHIHRRLLAPPPAASSAASFLGGGRKWDAQVDVVGGVGGGCFVSGGGAGFGVAFGWACISTGGLEDEDLVGGG